MNSLFKFNKLNRKKNKVLWLCLSVSLGLAGCASGPDSSMHVRDGVDPKYQDDNVRFRNTYYFRVFDPCVNYQSASGNTNGDLTLPEFQGLYRFKMTGKARNLDSKIGFESGTLKSWELDPLGSRVIYDKNINAFRYQSAAETSNKARREQAWQDYKKLLEEYKALKQSSNQQLEDDLKQLSWGLNTMLSNHALHGASLTETAPSNNFVRDMQSLVTGNQSLLTSQNSDFHTSLNSTLTTEVKKQLTAHIDNNRKVVQGIVDKMNADKVSLALGIVEGQINAQIDSAINAITDDSATVADLNTQLKAMLINLKASLDNDAFLALYIPGLTDTLIKNPAFTGLEKSDGIKASFDKDVASQTTGKDFTFSDAIDEATTQLDTMLTANQGDAFTDDSIKALYRTNLKDKVATLFAKDASAYKDVADKLELQLPTGSFFTLKEYLATTDPEIHEAQKQLLSLNLSHTRNALSGTMNNIVDTAIQNVRVSDIPNSVLSALQNAMTKKLEMATGVATVSEVEMQKIRNEGSDPIECSDINQENRGFQILGPEGWRTFDQDDRLVMAMTSSNEPLLNKLRQLSQKLLKGNEQNQTDLLPLVQAQLDISQSEPQLQSTEQTLQVETDPEKAVTQVCDLVNSLVNALSSDNTSGESSTTAACE